MASTLNQVKYDELQSISKTLNSESEAFQQLHASTRSKMDALRGQWVGEAAKAFFREQEGTLLPAVQRVSKALLDAHSVLDQIMKIIHDADAETAGYFRSFERESREDRRTDRRVDERIESDRRWGRKDGGNGDGHLSYDWVGGAILERYLTGGDDWVINNDPRWTSYMQNNQSLTQNLLEQAKNTATNLYSSGKTDISFDEKSAMAIENGEGIVGYQYLHGTNDNVGGFQRQGNAILQPDGNGGYTVTMNTKYTWNDIIDPNPQYSTDRWKSTIAEIITLGKADPYEIHISWDETTVIKLDGSGNVVSVSNP